VAIAASSGVSAGTSSAAGVASAVARAVGASTGTGAAQAFIVAIFASVGTSAGAGAAAGISAGIFASVGTSTGTGAANGRASAIAAAVGAAAGISGATGVGIGVFYAETLAGAALARLRFATSPGQPLDGVYIPPTRHQQVPPGTLSALTCYASSERGQGNNKSVPVLVLVDTLNIVGYVAQGREAATDLDQSVGKLIQAVLNLLLEDATFLALFAYVEAVNVEKEDDLTGKDAQEYDKVDFRIELELAGGQTEYTPVYTTPLRLIDVQATIGDVTVEQQVNFLQ
jgi:hypothetical protein